MSSVRQINPPLSSSRWMRYIAQLWVEALDLPFRILYAGIAVEDAETKAVYTKREGN